MTVRMNSEPFGSTSSNMLLPDVTDGEQSNDGISGTERARHRRKRRTRSVSLAACHSSSQRVGPISSTLSLPVDDSAENDESNTLTSSSSSFNFRTMSNEKKLTFINFCTTNFCVGCFYSLLGPFFPTEAAKKGVSTTIVGLIFGAYELTVVLSAPIFGKFLTQIGGKFTYTAGIFVCGSGSILFGFLDGSPDGETYIIMCFVVRFFEALGAAALSTASFAILANTFPDNVATVFGTLELFTGLGLMIGPPIGGVLFQLGGFKLPFIGLGSAMLVVCCITFFLMPTQDFKQQSSSGSMLSLLRIPIVGIMGLCLMSGSGSIGFIDVTLSIYMQDQYGLTPIVLGFVFLVGPGVYAIAAPIWGWIVDRTPQYNKLILCCGYTVGGISFFLMGPAPFLHIPHMLWLVIVSLAMMGIGISTLVVTFEVITVAVLSAGYPEGLDTYGLIAGLFNSFFSLGAFIGPLAGGYLHDLLGFEMSAVVIGSCSLLAAIVVFLYTIITWRLRQESSESSAEQQPLLNNTISTLSQYSSELESDRDSFKKNRTTAS